MPSTYSTDLKIELMVTGENAGTWGDKTNTNLNLVQQAIAGFESISIAGGAQTTNLVMTNAALSNARNAVIKLTGTILGNQIVTVPNGIEKTYIVQNGTTGVFTVEFKTVSGTGSTFSTTDKGIKILYSDGTNINTVDFTTLSGTIATAQIANLAVTSAKLVSFAVTEARLASFAVTTAKLATNVVTAAKIVQSTITQSKLAANSVGASQLISTGVVAASYTRATITVDADGRITSASSGTTGAGMGIPTRYSVGPASGTHTAAPTASRLGVYMYSGGGAAGSTQNQGVLPMAGGAGGYGFYNKPITQPFSQPFSVGGGGNNPGTTTAPGNAGGATNVGTVGTVNGGTGSAANSPGATGTAGTAPGASLTWPTAGKQFLTGAPYGVGGTLMGMGGPEDAYRIGGSGTGGVLVIFENTGT
jgi:hypothetical protein